MNLPPDLVARLAIRLARSYNQGWATAIRKDAVWNWATASLYIDGSRSQRRPRIVEDAIDFAHRDSLTAWRVSPREVQATFRDKADAFVADVTALEEPARIEVRLASFAAMTDGALWRVDKAVTSFSEGPWKHLHRLPPIRLVVQAFPEYLPTDASSLVYTDGRIASSYEPLETAIRRAGVRFVNEWERMRVL